MTYNQSVTLEFRESSDNGVAHIHTSLPLKEESFRISGGYRIYRYSIGPVDPPSQKPGGYYPLFVTVKSGRGTAALLMWVALLKKPVVEITDYPAVVEGNGSLAITVAGTVRYPDGRPVESGGVVWVTLNETKGKPGGVQLGRGGTVRHGRFIVNGTLEPGLPPGRYHVIAYYRGYEAYPPSNSDPTIVVRRKPPQLSVEIINSTLRLYLHWRNVPLANETLNVSIGSGVVTLKTDGEGYATLNLSGVRADSTNIVYGGGTVTTSRSTRPSRSRPVRGGHQFNSHPAETAEAFEKVFPDFRWALHPAGRCRPCQRGLLRILKEKDREQGLSPPLPEGIPPGGAWTFWNRRAGFSFRTRRLGLPYRRRENSSSTVSTSALERSSR